MSRQGSTAFLLLCAVPQAKLFWERQCMKPVARGETLNKIPGTQLLQEDLNCETGDYEVERDEQLEWATQRAQAIQSGATIRVPTLVQQREEKGEPEMSRVDASVPSKRSRRAKKPRLNSEAKNLTAANAQSNNQSLETKSNAEHHRNEEASMPRLYACPDELGADVTAPAACVTRVESQRHSNSALRLSSASSSASHPSAQSECKQELLNEWASAHEASISTAATPAKSSASAVHESRRLQEAWFQSATQRVIDHPFNADSRCETVGVSSHMATPAHVLASVQMQQTISWSTQQPAMQFWNGTAVSQCFSVPQYHLPMAQVQFAPIIQQHVWTHQQPLYCNSSMQTICVQDQSGQSIQPR